MNQLSKMDQPVLPDSLSTFQLVKALYKNDWNEPFELTPTQNLIFDCIFKKQAPDGSRRLHIKTYTQFGKSDVVSMALLTRVSTFAEKWVIVAPSQAKARIISGYVIKHSFDNEYTMSRLKLEEGESMEMLRRERSKNRLTFNVGDNGIGELFILSSESRLKNQEDIGNAMMGFGAPNLIEDESALIDDGADAKAMRMVGGFTQQGLDFVVKIGNPFRRNHFMQAEYDPAYYKINADFQIGLKEGRLTQKFIDEMRKKPFFSVLYENKYPNADEIDSKGFSQLISEDEIQRAMLKPNETPPEHAGERRLGVDVAIGGNNYSVWGLRSMNYAEIVTRSLVDNLTDVAARTIQFAHENKVAAEDVFVDKVALGQGVIEPLHQEKFAAVGVNVGEPAAEFTRFANLRAEAYWRLMEWIRRGGRLSRDENWMELAKIKWKPDHKGRVQIMGKETMRAMGIDSPDVADALMLTFTRGEHRMSAEMKRRRAEKRMKRREVNRTGTVVRSGGY